MTDALPPEADFADPLAVARRDLGERAADLGGVTSVTLREGPRGKKLARWMTIKNRHTGEVHHHALTIETGKKRQGSWELDDKRSITLSDDEVDEVGRLLAFVARVRGTPSDQEALPSRAASTARARLAEVARALDELPGDERAALLGELLGLLAGDREGLRRLAKLAKGHPTGLAGVAAALDYGRYARALDGLEGLLAEGAEVPALRALVGEHPWLVGCAHGLRPGRRLPPGLEREDLLIREAPDGQAVLVVLEAPHGAVMDRHDAPPHRWFPAAALAAALGRVSDDLAAWTAAAADAATAGEPPAPARGCVVIGRDADADGRAAVARLNARLAGVAVWTWDDVLRTGQRVLDALKATVQAQVAP